MKLNMRPLMTQYEYCLICAEKYESKGDNKMSKVYRNLMNKMTLEEAGRNI